MSSSAAAISLGFFLALSSIANAETPDCACYAFEKRFPQKHILCIRGQRMICGMAGNVSSWIEMNETCQVSFRLENYLLHRVE